MPLKTVLITGCGPGGIGSALATEFHMRGHRVFATDISADLAHLQDRGIETLALDVTSESSIEEAAAHISKLTGGKLDILINNAGVLHAMPFADLDVAAARRLFDVNVLGVVAVTKTFLPLLLAVAATKKDALAGGGGGDPIVANVCSVNSEIRPPFFGIYNASKAAVEVLSASIRPELAPFGVRVVTIKTGSINTELFRNAPPTRLPEESLYRPVKEFIEGRKMLEKASYMEPEVYAKNVVDELLRASVKRVIWQGGLTTFAWILSWFGWEGMMDGIYIRENKLDKCAVRST
ncbi:putative short-chain dehydrogenase/reductase [Hypoxylon rubiginosum]|uniref:Short-chain dehydrogenase/reductase n=1 Tax=Hypoxylon rubiginosum TaxID=110542 RepID=A0ACC0CP26_9PEZI|nr:putative short-chain dehydrogenase/reductase [Hypoxylon rubiginosum]